MRMTMTFIVLLTAVTLMAAPGCGTKVAPKTVVKKTAHDHPSKGPHGGALVEWGDEDYHLEFTVDHGKKLATVYILDDKAAKASPIAVETLTLILTHGKSPMEIPLKAEPEATDPKGKSSRFVGTHDELGKEIEFRGEIRGQVGNTPYTGEFVEKADHSHEKKK